MKSKCKLGDIISQRREKYNGENLPICGVTRDGFIPPKQKDADLSLYNVFYKDDFVFNPARMELNAIVFNDIYEKAICSSLYEIFYVSKPDIVLPSFLALLVKQAWFTRYCEFLGSGSAREYCRVVNISEIEIEYPDLDEQRRIVNEYDVIRNRIALKRRINDNLEAAMRALFEHFVVSNEAYDFDEAIDDKIDFINGLAMQNYRPEKDETPIPVIKIRELSQGYCDENSEFCSNHIDKSHIIQNGDLVFSWSGSLQASFWTSQTAGLNQHLFKVQSDEYPLWFVYEWVTFHLLNFQRIAENKGTTFGHIKREDLHNAKIKSVGIDEINKLNNLFQPLLNTIIANSTELHSLMNYQRVLLARLSR